MTHQLIPSREDFFFPLQQEFDKLFDEFFGPKRLSVLNGVKTRSGYPKMDIILVDGVYRIEMAVPGVESDDIKIEILPGDNGRVLRVSGKMAHDYQYSKEIDYYHRELTRAKFQRIVNLPDEVRGDPEAIIKNGMLTLTWKLEKKATEVEIKSIPVKKE